MLVRQSAEFLLRDAVSQGGANHDYERRAESGELVRLKIDYNLVSSLPEDIAYFHAEYRQATPNQAQQYSSSKDEINLNGKNNYTFVETRGKGHLMGVTLGVMQNAENWFGEGDEMIFIDDENSPVITGTGTEDYFCGAWDFGGKDTAIAFAHLYNGAPYLAIPERTGGRYCLYRWHADNPVAFTRYLKHTIEHGHADNRHDCYYSVAYWYQSQPYTNLSTLPAVTERIPKLILDKLNAAWWRALKACWRAVHCPRCG